jgi:inorganic pyrophosphatase
LSEERAGRTSFLETAGGGTVNKEALPEDLSVVEVMIAIPKGCRNKYEYDVERKLFRLDRMLFSAVHYPSDYGFIPETLAEDEDPLDAMVLIAEPTFPGCLIQARPIGLFKMKDEKGIDHKILCVPIKDPEWNYIFKLDDVPPHLLREIYHFFDIYKELEGKESVAQGWEDVASARAVIKEAKQRYIEGGGTESR